MTLGVQNVSFVAQAVDWIPEVLYDILSAAYHHKGFSFVRIIQRCPEWLPKMFEPWLQDPQKILLLHGEGGSPDQPELWPRSTRTRSSTTRRISIARARSPRCWIRFRSASSTATRDVPCYEDLRNAGQSRSREFVKAGLEAEFDKFTVWPQEAGKAGSSAPDAGRRGPGVQQSKATSACKQNFKRISRFI